MCIEMKAGFDRLIGRVESNGVYLGKDGYLIEKFTEPDGKNLKETCSAMGDFAKRYGAVSYTHLTMFMIVTNVSAAIGTEATLRFLGIGLPMEIISWGSMMSLSQQALLSNSWWIILIPGLFLVTTLVCITNVGEYIRLRNNREHSNL